MFASHTPSRRLILALIALSLPAAWTPVSAATPPATRPAGEKLMAEDAAPEPLTVRALLVDQPDERVVLLSNGMRVILKQYKVAPIVAVRMYVRTGSIYENPYLGTGLSHLFEHLLHGGTTSTRTEAESRELLLKIGGDSNAYTTYDHTCYYINTAGKRLGTAVDLLSDWITRATFPDSEFNREMGVVQRELERSVDEPNRQLHYLMMKMVFADHPAQFPVIGYKQNIQTLTKQDVVNYWRNRYIPDNVVVSICGDIDLDSAQQVILDAFADFTRRPLDMKPLPEAQTIVSQRSAVKRMNVSAAMLNMGWPSIRLTHPDLYALDVASYILTSGPSSRLTQELVYRQRLAAGVSGASWTPEWGRGVFYVQVRCPPENLVDVRKAILDEVRRLADEPVSEEELAKAKRQKAADYVQSLQTVDSMASMLAMDLISTGDPHFSADYVERIQQVTPEQIQRVARQYLKPASLASALIAPHDADLGAWQEATEAKKIGQPGEIRMVRLDNGLRVLLQNNPATPTVSIQLFTLGGLLAESEANNGISNLMAEASLRGTEGRTGEEIAAFFDSLGATINASAGSNTFFWQAEVLAEDLDKALPVLADVALHPAFKPESLEQVREPILDAIRAREENWRAELFDYVRSKYFGDYPYGLDPMGQVESVASLTPQDLRAFHDRYLVGGSSVLAIFGDIDEAKVEQQVRDLFGDMPDGQTPPLAPPAPGIANPGEVFVKAKGPDRQVGGVAIAWPSVAFTQVEDRMALTVLDTIISGYGLPSGWLHEALRGGTNKYVYEVHAINWNGLTGGFFPAYAGTQPEQVSKVISIVLEKAQKAVQGEFTDEELDRAKGVILTSQLLDRQTNAQRAMQASLDELYGLGYGFSDNLPELMEAIGMDDVKGVAKRYLGRQPVIVAITPDPDAVEVPGFEKVVEAAQTQPVQPEAGR